MKNRKEIGNKKVYWIEEMTPTLRKTRITMVFKLTVLGRHGICLRKFRAGDTPVFNFPVEYLRPCSQLKTQLYGVKK